MYLPPGSSTAKFDCSKRQGGNFDAAIKERQVNATFDPDGTGIAAEDSARLEFKFNDDFNLNWDIFSVSSGIYLSRPYKYFDFLLGYVATLHLGSATVTNVARGNLVTTYSPVTGSNVFETSDKAGVVLENISVFRPNLVSHNLPFIIVCQLGELRFALLLSRNITANINSILLTGGLSF